MVKYSVFDYYLLTWWSDKDIGIDYILQSTQHPDFAGYEYITPDQLSWLKRLVYTQKTVGSSPTSGTNQRKNNERAILDADAQQKRR